MGEKFPYPKWYHWWRFLKDWWFDDFKHVRQSKIAVLDNKGSKFAVFKARAASSFWMHFMMISLGGVLGFIVTRHSWLSIDARSAAQMCPLCYQDTKGALGAYRRL